jgi:hypothetical protein
MSIGWSLSDFAQGNYPIVPHRTCPDDLKYKGLYRVRVIPPRGLRIPVLPVRIDERLLFSCCHRCASTFRKSSTRGEHKCTHTDAQRAYTGTYTHIELAKALESGYKVDRFWRAWNYEKWQSSIFKDYVRMLIRLKVLGRALQFIFCK